MPTSTGSQSTARVGAIPYAAISTASRTSEEPRAIVSVMTFESGRSIRSNDMLRMIDRRIWIVPSPLMTLVMTSWNGTTAQAIESPGASPGRSRTTVTRTR